MFKFAHLGAYSIGYIELQYSKQNISVLVLLTETYIHGGSDVAVLNTQSTFRALG